MAKSGVFATLLAGNRANGNVTHAPRSGATVYTVFFYCVSPFPENLPGETQIRPLRKYRTCFRLALVVPCVALVVQAVYLVESRSDPTFSRPIVDAQVYHDAASRWADGGRLFEGAFWQPPLFPAFLGCIYKLTGPSVPAARVVLAGLAVLSCLLVWRLGCRLHSNRVGVIAGVMLAVYGPFVFFSTRLTPAGLAIFLNLLGLTLLVGALDRPTWSRWLAVGLCTGAAIATVPNSAVLFLLAVGWLIVSGARSRKWQPVLVHMFVVMLGMILVIAPVTVRNYLVSGKPVVLSTNGGINFFIGNNPESDRTVAIRPGEHWRRLNREATQAGADTGVDRNAYFRREALRYVRLQPLDFAKGLVRKTDRIINAREIPRNIDIYVHREFSRLLGLLIWQVRPFSFPFGLLMPLAVVGFIVSGRLADEQSTGGRTGRLPAMGFVVAYAVSVVLFFISARHRLPMACVMTIPAAVAIVWLIEQIRYRSRLITPAKTRWAVALAFLVTLAVVNRPITAPADDVDFRAEMYAFVAHSHLQQDHIELAEENARRAIGVNPQCAFAHIVLGDCLTNKGDWDGAEASYRRSIDSDPDSAEARRLCGQVVLSQGRIEEALSLLEEAARMDPCAAETQAALAFALVRAGKSDRAVEHFRLADQLAAQPGEVLLALADLLVACDKYGEAIDYYRRALWKIEPDAETLGKVAWLLATCPDVKLRDCEQSIDLAEHLCRITEYRQAASLDILAAGYAECGRFAEAMRVQHRAIELASQDDDTEVLETLRRRLKLSEQHLDSSRDSVAPDSPPTHDR